MTKPVVAEVRDLHVHFPVRHGRRRLIARAVDGVDLCVHEGEIVALVGESGCGKTTVARTIMRLVEASSGSVSVGGVDITHARGATLRRQRRDFQMIFQDPFESLPSDATALGVVSEGLAIHRGDLDAAARRRVALSALEMCGLTPAAAIAQRRIFALSGGQRQRVAIAAALALEPRLLVADEPVSMLDVSLRAGVIRVLLDMRERLGVAILFITHDLALAGVFADRVAVLYLGRVVEQGPAAEVIGTPRHPYTRALVGVMPKAGEGRRAARTLLTGEPPNATSTAPGCSFAPRCPLYRQLGQPERCRTEQPILAAATPDHAVACHFSDLEESPTPKENTT
ncbi:ABC transporter ATP-binding protein [Mycobacterium sp. shizuoka-1]|uniref:oligopeptide/dipeptide ABC transporter ATP-binding protein n=1 Tax=Mycobacterium sp. shizuoka-1 TaxID=2039281 RepID=UPI000C060EFD|nr:ABC transporter ATP-binding protein [Mycobacterium sp. shizuoka-1]GAY18309.1 peptide ABC transporter ATP-binding protein [Mycobacterium sp. shizuoka-1]